jgi:hypothetical protein
VTVARKERDGTASGKPLARQKAAADEARDGAASVLADTGVAPSPWQGELPLFYKNPQILSAERHRSAGIRESTDLSFARDTNSVALGANELFPAHFDFPVVFTESNPPLPVAVLGVGGSHNTFVEATGRWRANTYIPAYIRRYPFIAATGTVPGPMHLAIDEAAACFDPDGGQRLFDGDGPGPLTRQAVEFCLAFQVQLDIARAFGEALQEAGVLVPKRADVQLPDGSRMSLDRFRVVDEGRVDVLPDATFLVWRRRGWLGLVYAHLLSMRRWEGFSAAPAGA